MENVTVTKGGYRLQGEIRDVPVAFVNSLRRTVMSDIPVVTITNVQILDNKSKMTHEMLRHRMEMIPIAVKPEESAVIRDTTIELRYLPSDKERTVTTDDFVVVGPRKDVILKDRDLDTPLLFMYLDPGESVHIRANLAVEPRGLSHVCVSAHSYHIDPEQARTDEELFVQNGGDPRVFKNFYIQRSYSRDPDTERPLHFDFVVESIGVLDAPDIVKRAAKILRAKFEEFGSLPILREGKGEFMIRSDELDPYTIGHTAQVLIYNAGLADYVGIVNPHPLKRELELRFTIKSGIQPEAIMTRCKEEALALCENILRTV
jgi:HD-GYP domain-containing protein (c-di-GMP phosphodiesterase class II)